MTNVSAFKLCSVNINEGRQGCANAVKTFTVIIQSPLICSHSFNHQQNLVSLLVFWWQQTQFNYSLFPSIPCFINFLFYFILFSIFFPFVCTHRMLARLLDQAFRRIGHPSQGQHAQLVSILHHLCSDSDPVDQVWNMDFLKVYI